MIQEDIIQPQDQLKIIDQTKKKRIHNKTTMKEGRRQKRKEFGILLFCLTQMYNNKKQNKRKIYWKKFPYILSLKKKNRKRKLVKNPKHN